MRGDGSGLYSIEHGVGNGVRGLFSAVTGLRREATDTILPVDESANVMTRWLVVDGCSFGSDVMWWMVEVYRTEVVPNVEVVFDGSRREWVGPTNIPKMDEKV